MNAYMHYLRVVVVAYNEELAFYEHCGFKKADDANPMFITSLWTKVPFSPNSRQSF